MRFQPLTKLLFLTVSFSWASAYGETTNVMSDTTQIEPTTSEVTHLIFSCSESPFFADGNLVLTPDGNEQRVSGNVRFINGDHTGIDTAFGPTDFDEGFTTLLSPFDMMIAELKGDNLALEFRLSDGTKHFEFPHCEVEEVATTPVKSREISCQLKIRDENNRVIYELEVDEILRGTQQVERIERQGIIVGEFEGELSPSLSVNISKFSLNDQTGQYFQLNGTVAEASVGVGGFVAGEEGFFIHSNIQLFEYPGFRGTSLSVECDIGHVLAK